MKQNYTKSHVKFDRGIKLIYDHFETIEADENYP